MTQDNSNIEGFRDQLDNHYDFPTDYRFKFIVPKEKVGRLKSILPKGKKTETKKSRTGKYVGVSLTVHVDSSDQIINIYKKAYVIKGIISL